MSVSKSDFGGVLLVTGARDKKLTWWRSIVSLLGAGIVAVMYAFAILLVGSAVSLVVRLILTVFGLILTVFGVH
jgi:hypothetical protein